jgi:SAM-dependent methyltransferase
VRGYDESTYGDGMADIYDEWYPDSPEIASAVATLARLAEGGPVLELGVGTGRLALPLSATGVEVHGVDASAAMVAKLRAKSGADRVNVVVGSMAGAEPSGPFRLVFAVANTFFGLLTAEAQMAGFANAARRLVPGGRLVIEAFVPDVDTPTARVEVRSLDADRVVLRVSAADPDLQTVDGHFVELSNTGGVQLRPWSIRWATPAQLDDMASASGLTLEHRWGNWGGDQLQPDGPVHVSVWRRQSSVG